jgi:hypothetical protein
MFGFLVKKAFFDMWDNFLAVVIINLGFIALLMIPVFLPPLFFSIHPLVFFLVQAIGIIILFVYAGVVSLFCRDIANYKQAEWGNILRYLKESWRSSLVLGLINVGIVVVGTVGFPTYMAMENMLGWAAMVFLMWAIVIWLLASQFYFPIRGQLDSKVGKILRKSFILFFDNTFLAIVLAIGAIIATGVSALTAFLIPGIGGLLIWYQVALKLRLYKYDYLEENPGANRRQIPWDALLIDDREKVGKRTFRGMIFPWKE